MTAPPTVSVIVAAYNGVAVIAETLNTLAAQSFADWEAVVVDDGSADDTLAMLRAWPDPRVRTIASERNGGPVVARNRAIADARGRYWAGLDQDDLCRPERLARQVAYLDANPDTVLVGTATRTLENGALRLSPYAPITTPRLVEWLLHIENPLVWSSVMIRAEAARRLTPFTRPELTYAEDFDLYHRLAPFGRIARLDEELVIYRQHGGGVSKKFAETMRAGTVRVLSERYQPMLGDGAAEAAELVVDHLMTGLPVPDRDTLAQLGATMIALQAEFLARHPSTDADRRLIRWETARRWANVARAGLRTGSLDLGDAFAVRPGHLGLGYQGIEQLVWSRLIGSARSAGRRLRRSA